MKTKWFLRAFAIIAGISFASCDDKNKDVTPVFPEMAEYTVAVGETKELSFTANTTWSLSTDQSTWCVFMDGDVERVQKTGQAGEITVTVKVKDNKQEFDADDVATISLTMQGEKKPIFKITRPGKTRQVTMYKREGGAWVEIPKVELEYKSGRTSSLEIGFTANFAWKVLSESEGIVMGTALSGKANGTTSDADFKTSYISLPTEMLPEPFSGGIVISDLDGENTISFDVTYAGMGDNDLFFSDAHLRPGSDPSVTFSNKGYVISRDAIPQPTEEMSFSFTAFTKGMNSTGYIVSFDGETAQIAASPWLALTDNKDGSYSIAVDGAINLGDARDLHVFILPDALVSATPDFSPYFADGQSKGIYNFKVSQEAAPTGGGLYIGWGVNQTAIADGRLVAWNDHPGYKWDSPGDMGAYGLQADNAYIYEFSNADIDGGMVIAPYGITLAGFNISDLGAPIGTATPGTFQGAYCVTISGIKTLETGGCMTWVTFNDGVSQWTPKIGVLLVQRP